VNQAKVVISEDLGRRWTLAGIADLVGVSPVYLTQVFQRAEGMPLYQYQLQLRLAKALDLLGIYPNLTDLALTHGFSSHSRFCAALLAVRAGQHGAKVRKLLRNRANQSNRHAVYLEAAIDCWERR
jgi:AraC-like DNA-binding protein